MNRYTHCFVENKNSYTNQSIHQKKHNTFIFVYFPAVVFFMFGSQIEKRMNHEYTCTIYHSTSINRSESKHRNETEINFIL